MAATSPPATSTVPESRAPWLLRAKVTAPESAEGYFHRPALLRQLDPAASRRISVLRAPGGFGKTTTLAEIVRRARKKGVLVAWLTVDEDDAPGLFGAHLAYAFEHAGLELVRTSEDAWGATPLTHQIGMLVRAIETHAKSCLLVLDELERLPAQSVDLLERLLRRGPRNLQFALSFRTNPGLDLAGVVLEGSAVFVTTAQFRFTKSEIGRFFEGSLSRQELAETFDRTAGWPVALRIDRTIRETGSAESVELGKALTRNFLDMRLLRRLSDRDCTLLLDLSIFDWVDTNLVDEVLETTNTRLRLEGLLALDGLLAPVDPDGAVRRLHPVVKQHCLRLLAGQDPARVQQLHRRISEALTRRDQLIPAWRHAAETGDREFLGETMERVGVFRMWLREGMTCLAAADRFLTPALLEEFPRLALIRCVARRLRLQFDEARALYQTTKPKLEDMARRRGEGYLPAMLIDRLFTQVSLVGAHFRSDRDATGMQETGSGGAECQQQAGGERQWTSHQRCGQLSASSARPAPPSWNSSPTVAAGYCVAQTRRWGVRANRRDLVDRDLLDCLAGAGPEDPSRRPRRLRESLRSRATRVPRSAPLGDQCFSGMHWVSAGRRAGCRPYRWRDGSCYASESPSNRSGRSHQIDRSGTVRGDHDARHRGSVARCRRVSTRSL